MIGYAKWYIGGSSTDNDVTAPMFYTRERGTTVYSGRSTSWIGKVGLMYPSDYGYATSGDSTTSRTTCLAEEMFSWYNASSCYKNDWLFKSSYMWTISSGSSAGNFVFSIYNSGREIISDARNGYGVWPVTYLKSTINITSGTGSSTDPFILRES